MKKFPSESFNDVLFGGNVRAPGEARWCTYVSIKERICSWWRLVVVLPSRRRSGTRSRNQTTRGTRNDVPTPHRANIMIDINGTIIREYCERDPCDMGPTYLALRATKAFMLILFRPHYHRGVSCPIHEYRLCLDCVLHRSLFQLKGDRRFLDSSLLE